MTRRFAAAAALLLTLGSGCLADHLVAPATVDGTALQPIPELDLSGAEPRAQEAIRQARHNVDRLLAEPGASRTDLAAAFGRLGSYFDVYTMKTSAEACYANAIALEPGEFRWSFLYAYLAYVGGRFEEALARFAAASQIDPAYAPIDLYEGEALFELNRPDEAEPHLLAAVAHEGLRASAAFRLGQIAFQRREYKAAIDYFRTALAADPEADAVWFPLGQSLRAAGDADGAREAIARRGRDLPRVRDPIVDELQALDEGSRPFYVAGLAAARQNDFAAAATAFGKGLEQDPDNVLARTSYGRALFLTGRVDEARSELERAEKIAGNEPSPTFFLGLLDKSQGDDARARERFAKVLAIDPDHSGALYFLGLMDFSAGDYARAADRLEQSVTAERGNVYAQVLALVARYRTGVAPSVLVPPLEAVADAAGKHWLPRYALSRMLAAGEDPAVVNVARARELAESLVELQVHPAAYEALALARAAGGDFDAAGEALQAAKSAYFFNGRFGDVARIDRQLERVSSGELPAAAWPEDDPVLTPPVISPRGPFLEYPAPRAY